MFLDSEPEGEIQLPRSGMPLKEKKRTATLLTATEKIYMFLSSSPSVTKGKPFFFSSVKGSVHGQALTCKSSFDMLICACNTAFILSRNYMHAWHAVPSCSLNDKQEFMRKMHEPRVQDIRYLSRRLSHTVNALPAAAIQYLRY